MSPARVEGGAQRGWIVPVGGAEDKVHDVRILKRFVALCGGKEARIAVIVRWMFVSLTLSQSRRRGSGVRPASTRRRAPWSASQLAISSPSAPMPPVMR